VLFVGDDWAQDHHDVEIQDESGRRLAKSRLPEGVAGMARLHALLGEHLDADTDADQVAVASRPIVDRGCARWLPPATEYSQSIRCSRHGSGNGTMCRAPRVTPVTRTHWPTWFAPTPIRCGKLPVTVSWPRRSRWSPEPT